MENPEDRQQPWTLATVDASCIPDVALLSRPEGGNRTSLAWSRALDTDLPEPDLLLDARGHHCPVPTLRLRRALETLARGQVIRLMADDPMARIDVPHFVSQAGHDLIDSRAVDTWQEFVVRKQG